MDDEHGFGCPALSEYFAGVIIIGELNERCDICADRLCDD